MSVDLLAIDPSIRSPGAALFRDSLLIAVARVTFAVDTRLNEAERCIVAADAIINWATNVGAKPAEIAHEWPQVYADGKGKGDPNDLPYMAGVDLAVVAAFALRATLAGSSLRVYCYKPAEWIGQLPKATRGSAKASPRGRRICSRLGPDELAILPDQHDAIDAVGIGLHKLGRLGVRRALTSG